MKKVIKLAIADNHPILRQGLISLLHTNKDFKVIAEASNGNELLAIFAKLEQLPDIAILDINMPEKDGYSTAQEITAIYSSVKIIALSFHENEFNIIKMIKNGAVSYLAKGSTGIVDLVKAIEGVHYKGYYYSDVFTGELFEKAINTKLPEFTNQELQYLKYCCDGLSDKEIADKMFLSPRTVEYYYAGISNKLGISKRIGLVAYALKTGIIPLQ